MNVSEALPSSHLVVQENSQVINKFKAFKKGSFLIQQYVPEARLQLVCKNWKQELQTLHWKHRPSKVQKMIDETFDDLTSYKKCRFKLYEGSSNYLMTQVYAEQLMLKLIYNDPQRKNFYALDVGGGNFQWGFGMAKFLNSKKMRKDVVIHIISVRGESSSAEPIQKVGQCILYNYGSFKIEELQKEFKKKFLVKKLPYKNFVDLAITRWTLRHLVDPVGTFAQIYNVLRPEAGYFLGDGFYSTFDKQDLNSKHFDHNLIRVLSFTQSPFLVQGNHLGGNLNHFIVNRKSNRPCRFPLNYQTGISVLNLALQVNSLGIAINFKTTTNEIVNYDVAVLERLCGDKPLHHWLYTNEIFYEPKAWGPLEKNAPIESFPYMK